MKRRFSSLSAAGLATLAMAGVANAELYVSDDFEYDLFAGFVGAFGRGQGFTGGFANSTSGGWLAGTGWGAFSNAGITGRAQDGTDLDNKVISGSLGGGGAGSGAVGRTWTPLTLSEETTTVWFSLGTRHQSRARLAVSDAPLISRTGDTPDGDNTFSFGFAPGGGIFAQIGPVNNAEQAAENEMIWNNDDLGFNTLFNQGPDPEDPEMTIFGSQLTLLARLDFDVNGGPNERLTLELLDPVDNSILATRMFEKETALTNASGLGDQVTVDITPDNVAAVDFMAIGATRDAVSGLVNPIVPRLTLTLEGGQAKLVNNSGTDLDIDGILIESASGSLNAGSLTGLSGDGWATNQATGSRIVQSNFTSSTVIPDGGEIELGEILGAGATADDLRVLFNSATGTQNVGRIDLPAFVLGDMNGDGVLDAFDVAPFELALADRAAYEAAFPGIDADLVGDVNGEGGLDAFDVAPFEALLAGGGSTAVPEPASLALLGLGLASLARRRR